MNQSSAKTLVRRIEELFFQKLELKTGYGRNEIKDIYREAVHEAILEWMDAA